MGWRPSLDLSAWKRVYGRDPIKWIYGCFSLRKSESLLKAWLAGARAGPGSRSLRPPLSPAAIAPQVLIQHKSLPVTAAHPLCSHPAVGSCCPHGWRGAVPAGDGCGDGDSGCRQGESFLPAAATFGASCRALFQKGPALRPGAIGEPLFSPCCVPQGLMLFGRVGP